LLERTRIYATEATDSGVAKARLGALKAQDLPALEECYLACGGTRHISEYLDPTADGASFKRTLTQNVLFARHYVAVEGSFNEFAAVIMRASLEPLGRALAYRVHETLYESTIRLGFLSLSAPHDMENSPHRGASAFGKQKEKAPPKRGLVAGTGVSMQRLYGRPGLGIYGEQFVLPSMFTTAPPTRMDACGEIVYPVVVKATKLPPSVP